MKKPRGVLGMGDYRLQYHLSKIFPVKPHTICAFPHYDSSSKYKFNSSFRDFMIKPIFLFLLCLCMILHLSELYFFALIAECKLYGLSDTQCFFPRLSETWQFQLKWVVGLLEPEVMLMLLTCHFADSRRGTSSTCTTMSMLWWCQGSVVCDSHASGAAGMIQKNPNRKHRRFWPASGL